MAESGVRHVVAQTGQQGAFKAAGFLRQPASSGQIKTGAADAQHARKPQQAVEQVHVADLRCQTALEIRGVLTHADAAQDFAFSAVMVAAQAVLPCP